MDAAVLESQAMELSEQERAILVDRLQQSLSSSRIPHLDEHLAESHSRFDSYKAGKIEALDGQKVVSDLRAGLQE